MKEGNKKESRGKYRIDKVFKKERSAEFYRNVMHVVYSTAAVKILPLGLQAHYAVCIYLFIFLCIFVFMASVTKLHNGYSRMAGLLVQI